MDISSPLFQAHQNGRKAEALLKKFKFEEAIQCHLKASECLLQAMKLTKFSRSLESLQLQSDYHIRQIEIVRLKQAQWEIHKELLAYKSRKMEKPHSLESQNVEDDADDNIQLAIFRTMEEADSLLGLLTSRGEGSEGEEGGGEEGASGGRYCKHPKDERTMMEELREVNAQLRCLVRRLVAQLEASRAEAESLRSRLRLYEAPPLPDLAPLDPFHFPTNF